MEWKLRFAIVYILSMLLASDPSMFSLALSLVTPEIPIAQGPLGSHLYYRMYSPTILKIGTNTTISFIFSAQAEIFVKTLYIGVWGSAYRPIPDFSISYLVESNKSLDMWESINYSILVKPLEEGNIVVRVSVEYNFKGGSEYDYHDVIIDAKSMTYDELRQRYLLFQYLTFGFVISTIVLILIVARVYVKKKK